MKKKHGQNITWTLAERASIINAGESRNYNCATMFCRREASKRTVYHRVHIWKRRQNQKARARTPYTVLTAGITSVPGPSVPGLG